MSYVPPAVPVLITTTLEGSGPIHTTVVTIANRISVPAAMDSHKVGRRLTAPLSSMTRGIAGCVCMQWPAQSDLIVFCPRVFTLDQDISVPILTGRRPVPHVRRHPVKD